MALVKRRFMDLVTLSTCPISWRALLQATAWHSICFVQGLDKASRLLKRRARLARAIVRQGSNLLRHTAS